jgi:uncharacterized membrane protein YfcA
MREMASRILRLLAKMIVGGMLGAWLLNRLARRRYLGVLVGAFALACFRPWPTSNPNSDGDPTARGEGPHDQLGMIVHPKKEAPTKGN